MQKIHVFQVKSETGVFRIIFAIKEGRGNRIEEAIKVTRIDMTESDQSLFLTNNQTEVKKWEIKLLSITLKHL